MSSNRAQWTDRSAAESLTAVLRAATAPAYPEELFREEAASAAFVNAAQLAPVPQHRRSSMLRSALAKVLTVKVAVILAAVGSTGVVLAAGTNALPGPWSGTPASPPASSRSADPSAPPSVTTTGRPPDAGKPAETGPAPSMTGLCQAYAAQVAEEPGKALDSPAFTALVTAAGGADRVPAYCDSVTATSHPSGKPSDLPAGPENGKPGGGSPTARPTQPSQSHTPARPAPGAARPSDATRPTQGG
jgi:hypothetical protein